jgi:hypothetical protein
MLDKTVSPVVDVIVELLSQARSLFGCGCRAIVTTDALVGAGSRVTVVDFSLIFTTIIEGRRRVEKWGRKLTNDSLNWH